MDNIRDRNNKLREAGNGEWSYWKVFAIGLLYIVLLGLFTLLFNNPL